MLSRRERSRAARRTARAMAGAAPQGQALGSAAMSASLGLPLVASRALIARMNPGSQKPQRPAFSATHAACTGSWPVSPSIVVTTAPSNSRNCIWQARTGWPSTSTVQAWQLPSSQPCLAPVRLAASRSAKRSGISGSRRNRTGSPLRRMLLMAARLGLWAIFAINGKLSRVQ